MKIFAALLLLFVVYGEGRAADVPSNTFTCPLVSVGDGDTVCVSCDGWPLVFANSCIRVAEIDAPEKTCAKTQADKKDKTKKSCVTLTGKAAKEAKRGAKCDEEKRRGLISAAWAKKHFSNADEITFTIRMDRGDKGLDNSRRILADVMLPDGKDWAKEAVRTGMAAYYDPDVSKSFDKPDWCGVKP
jgi:endonuclease YncB( thermonuclease family)